MLNLAESLQIPGHPAIVVALVVLTAVLPLAIFFGQSTVGNRRLAILEYLKSCANNIEPSSRDFMVRSLEFAGARYASAQDPYLRCLAYLLPTALFVLLSAFGFIALLAVISMQVFEARNFVLLGLQPFDAADIAGYQAGTALVVAAAFLGAYVWSVNYLVLRVSNYDLNPLSFLRVATHLLLTIFAACVLRHVFAATGTTMEGLTVSALLGASFLMGFFPNLGIGVLIDRLPAWLRVKRPVDKAEQISCTYPLDMIDGITPSIKFRLESFDITDVHNLATADPVTLYLESPFGHLEILDWIGQAQLLACLGPERYLKCRAANIRDIHGLLRIGREAEGRPIIKGVLFDDGEASDAAIEVTVATIASALHVRRLELWWQALTAVMEPKPVGERTLMVAAE